MRFLALSAVLVAACFGAPACRAAEALSGPIPAAVVRVLDGDTFEAKVRLWLDIQLTVLVRIDGIDAPELSSRCPEERKAAMAARAYLSTLLAPGLVTLSAIRHDKYAGRVVAGVRLPSGETVGQSLLASGHALATAGARVQRCP